MNGAVVNVAVNGYGWIYPSCADSHQQYADRHGYDLHRLVAPKVQVSRPDAAWAKIDLLLHVLDAGEPWALLLDADAEVSTDAPPMASVEDDGGDIYAARGRSGRWNSGVLIVKNTDSSQQVLREIRDSRDTPVEEDQWGSWTDWGENGHVIHALDRYQGARELPTAWNNSIDPDLPSHIRHFTGNLSRSSSRPHKLRRSVVKRLVARRPTLDAQQPDRAGRMSQLIQMGYF